MILMKPNFELIDKINSLEIYKKIESIGRVCYKSEDKITDDSYIGFIKGLLKRAHESVIEHVNITGKFICDRGVMAELTRHRICSFSIESSRYCNYKDNVTFIIPTWMINIQEGEYKVKFNYEELPIKHIIEGPEFLNHSEDINTWIRSCSKCENDYLQLLEIGWNPQQARSVLPNSLKTEIVVTANLREWRHIFRLRLAKTAHPDMQTVMRIAFNKMYEKIPLFFEDIKIELGV